MVKNGSPSPDNRGKWHRQNNLAAKFQKRRGFDCERVEKTASIQKRFNSYKNRQLLLSRAIANSIVIDDAQYLMAFEYMERAKEVGFTKFNDIGQNFFYLVKTAISLPDNKIVYFLMHIERTDAGTEKAKTIGQIIDNKITLEGLFTIVLKTVVQVSGKGKREYFFSTENNGADTVKSPMGMFEGSLIDNDLKLVDDTIRRFYEI